MANDYLILVAVCGRKAGLFGSLDGRSTSYDLPGHVYAVQLRETSTGQVIWDNLEEPAVWLDGAANGGYLAGVYTALAQVPDGGTVAVLYPHDKAPLAHYYAGEVRKYHHRNAKGKPFAPRDELQRIDELAISRGLILLGRTPETEDEREWLSAVSDAVEGRAELAEDAAMSVDR